MARKEINGFEVVSAVIPGEGNYRAAVAIKAIGMGGAPRFCAIPSDQTFKTAHDADVAAVRELERPVDVDAEGEPVWAQA